jgi:hypothetical protein
MQGGAQALDERHGCQFTEFAKGLEDTLAGGGGQDSRLGQLLATEA